ncbi:glycoside hydrolase family 25 protein [Amycolatopsis sp. NBC_01480]|uniref:glycoside hydrolase family 25 protein n=1 Tax=Amycolatopsis sp. NBC_01480 TaxID=2903562 RepID=UPI002E29DA4E|nr:GH25 family lysozyme [Amycolatopsis sp. NBC_01480]
MSRGIDISHHNVCTDYAAAKSAVDWVYIKVTEGSSFVDPSIDEHHGGFAGKPRGPYHFMRGSSAAEVATFVAQVRARAWELPPMLDAEYQGVTSAGIKAFLAEYQRQTGQELTVVYSSESLFTGACNPAGFITGNTVLWAARYSQNSADFSTLGWDHPQLGIYQYWDKGFIPGFAGGIDLDIARVDLGSPQAPSAPSTTIGEDDMAFGTPAPAGTNEHVDLGVVGCKQLRIHTSFGHVVHVRAVLFYGDTGADPNGTGEGGGYDGEFRTPKARWDWAPNRPGPIAIPVGSTSCTVLYDADHAFYVSAALR